MDENKNLTAFDNCLKIGAHLSVAKGYRRMIQDAVDIGANTLQFFARNPRGVRAKAVNEKEMEEFRLLIAEHNFSPIIAHSPYTMNLCSANSHLREISGQMMEEDLKKMEYLPGNYYNLHPGSRLGQPMEYAVGKIASMLNKAMFPEMKTMILLETMAGKGSEVGRYFEELKEILDRVELGGQVGICMDVCHMWDSGYPVAEDLEGVLKQFDQIIGLKRVKAFHINDSMNPRGSRKDRHTTLGDGSIGLETIIKIINHPSLCHLPFILETPTDLAGHSEEIRMLRKAFKPDV